MVGVWGRVSGNSQSHDCSKDSVPQICLSCPPGAGGLQRPMLTPPALPGSRLAFPRSSRPTGGRYCRAESCYCSCPRPRSLPAWHCQGCGYLDELVCGGSKNPWARRGCRETWILALAPSLTLGKSPCSGAPSLTVLSPLNSAGHLEEGKSHPKIPLPQFPPPYNGGVWGEGVMPRGASGLQREGHWWVNCEASARNRRTALRGRGPSAQRDAVSLCAGLRRQTEARQRLLGTGSLIRGQSWCEIGGRPRSRKRGVWTARQEINRADTIPGAGPPVPAPKGDIDLPGPEKSGAMLCPRAGVGSNPS